MPILLLGLGLLACGCGAGAEPVPADAGVPGPPADAGPPPLPTLPLPVRADVHRCRLDGTRPDGLPHLRASDAVILDPTAARPRRLLAVPRRDEELLALMPDGRLLRVSTVDGSAALLLDLRAEVWLDDDGRGGLIDVALAADFADSGTLYLSYADRASATLQVVRVHVDVGAGSPNAPRLRVLQQPLLALDGIGGGLALTPDGMLFVGVGDGGAAPGPGHPAQTGDGWAGKVLRVDVASLSQPDGYRIPADNPTNARQPQPTEVYARGLRDPHDCLLSDGGLPYCLDRGLGLSELLAIEAADNHGWPIVDGPDCVDPDTDCNPFDYAAALDRLRHDGGTCDAVALLAVRDGGVADLPGSLVYADACTGRMFGARLGSGVARRDRIGTVPGGVTALGETAGGALFAATADGQLRRLELAADGTPGSFPERISATDCYSDVEAHTPAPGLVAFDVASPLWSDAAHKRRYLALPPGETIGFDEEGAYTFPEGAVLIKEFLYDFDDGVGGTVRRPVETRFMRVRDGAWDFHNYRWDAEGRDATLLLAADDALYGAVAALGVETLDYHFPGPRDCPVCHGAGPGAALGPRTAQLNHPVQYDDGQVRAQLSVWAEHGLLDDGAAATAAGLPSMPRPDDPRPALQDRARSYLHANCAHCHRPGGWVPANLTMDLRWGRTLVEAALCDAPTQYGRPGRIRVVPGAPDDSQLLLRMLDTGFERMPPLATSAVDPYGSALVAAWIRALTPDCLP